VVRQEYTSPACLVFGGDKPPVPGNRMREILTSGSVGGASGNRRIYPEPDAKKPAPVSFVIIVPKKFEVNLLINRGVSYEQ